MTRNTTLLSLLTFFVLAGSTTAGAQDSRELCGRVWSRDHPIEGVTVLAATEGVVARSDSTGRFCLRGLQAELQRVQVIGLGFQPVDLWVQMHESMDAIRIELTPLRTLTTDPKPSPSAVKEDVDWGSGAKRVARPEPLPTFLWLPEDELWRQPELRTSAAAVEGGENLLEILKVSNFAKVSADSLVPPAFYWRSLYGHLRLHSDRNCSGEKDFALLSHCPLADRMLVYCGAAWAGLLRDDESPMPDSTRTRILETLRRVEQGEGTSLADWTERVRQTLQRADEAAARRPESP